LPAAVLVLVNHQVLVGEAVCASAGALVGGAVVDNRAALPLAAAARRWPRVMLGELVAADLMPQTTSTSSATL
jgi:hypothetical protein